MSEEPEIWQVCFNCNGQGGKAEKTAYLDGDTMHTVEVWCGCGTCLGTGYVRGGTQ